jgi:hypothetical protein
MGCGDVEQTYDWPNKGVDGPDPMIIIVSQRAPLRGTSTTPDFMPF